MPAIRVRSRVPASAVHELEAYLSEATKSVAHAVSAAVLSEGTFAAEVVAIARCSPVKRPLLGLIVSWPAGVDVTTEAAIEATALAIKMITGSDRLLTRIDAHGDATHRHTHAAVLVIDPETYRVPRLQLQRDRIEEVQRAINVRLGHVPTAARRDDRLTAGARDAEIWNGTMSFERWLTREIDRLAPTSWKALDTGLAGAGIQREPGALRGHRFVDVTTAKTFRARASKVGLTPAHLAPWGPAPSPPVPIERERPSYGELLQMRALPSPLLTAERQALHDRWLGERRTVPGTLSQFGAWLRRQATDTKTTNLPTTHATRSKTVTQHNGGSIGDGRQTAVLSRDEMVELLARRSADMAQQLKTEPYGNLETAGHLMLVEARLNAQRERVLLDDVATAYAVPLDRHGELDPLGGFDRVDERDTGAGAVGPPPREPEVGIEQCYQELSQQYQHYLEMRIDSDRQIGETLKTYQGERTGAERDLQRNVGYVRDAKGDSRFIAVANVAEDLAALARMQERATLTLALYETELRALAPVSFAEFTRRDHSLGESARAAVLALAADDRAPERIVPNGFTYDEGLARLAHLDVVFKDDEIHFISRPVGDLDEGVSLFVERDGLFHVDRSNSTAKIDAALATAARLYDNKVTIEGDDVFVELALERAVALGIDVTTPALRERFERLKAAHAERDAAELLPAWAAADPSHHRELERSDEVVGNLTIDGLRRLIAKSAFGEGVTSVVDARELKALLECAYLTTIVVDAVPVVVSQADDRIVLSPLPPSADAREPRTYGEWIVVNADSDRSLHVVQEQERGRDITLAR